MFNSPFEDTRIKIDRSADVVFVADLFVENYVGGAELTTQALIDASDDVIVQKLHAQNVTLELLEAGMDKHWIFGNFSTLNPQLIPSIIGNISYSNLEYDYKFCQHRSIEKHLSERDEVCDCHNELHGKMVSSFFHGAKTIWWMSEEQERRYLSRFPFLEENDRVVLSSVFDESYFAVVKALNDKYKEVDRKGWIVLGAESWIKGASDAIAYCEENNLEYEVLWKRPYGEVLERLATAEGLVYLPRGGDTCPRMVIEAKMLGCELVLNQDVQHADEEWFKASPIDMVSYLYAARNRFWVSIKSVMGWTATISGYTTVRNANDMGYPWKACVESMLGFCDEVIVVDGGSNDNTWKQLQEWSKKEQRIKGHQISVNPDDPSFAYESDGKLKAKARDLCKMQYCWQMDADEILHEDDYEQVRQIIRNFPKMVDIVALPIIEYWGSKEKVRVDINPWKWRLSRNLPHITQGIPAELRKFDDDGNEYAGWGTDTCDYIHKESRERLPIASFYTEEVNKFRAAALEGDKKALEMYEGWYNSVVEQLPTVHHYSWFDISAKIKQYRKHWAKFWKSQYRLDIEDTAKNNVMFNKAWSDVTDNDINIFASRLATEMGGWIFHEPVNFSAPTPHVVIGRNHPQAYLDNVSSDKEEEDAKS